ncbi:MAG: putative lipoprotein [Parcubacteria group bacterium]|nr:putative lipoprotein [Parcubacteria group bacterium]
MHKAVALPFIVIAAVVVGGLLYLFGGPSFHPQISATNPVTAPAKVAGNASTLVLGHGTSANGFDQRVNYRITDVEQFAALWQMVYANNAPALPTVDFSKYEVLAVFDGSHTSGGYDVQVKSIEDASGNRTIHILHSAPGDACTTASAISSPFVIVQVSASTLPVTHIDDTQTNQC